MLADPNADLVRTLWLLGLSFAMLYLWAQIRALGKEQKHMLATMQEVATQVAGLRRDLGQVAQAQQVEELRRLIVTELRPMILDAVDGQLAARPRARKPKSAGPLVQFSGQAQIGAAVAGDVGTISGG